MKPIHGLGLAGLMLVAAGLRPAEAGEEWRYLSAWTATHSLSEKATVSLLAEAYFRDEFSGDYSYDGYLTHARKMGGGFGLFGQLFAVTSESDKGAWTTSGAVVVGATHTTDIPFVGRLRLQDRAYYRVTPPAGLDHHRPRVFLSREFGPVTLVLSDEVRLDLSGDRARNFFRNRLFATVLWKTSDTLTVGLGYFRQSDREDDGGWGAFNGVQSVVTVAF